jgi:hypothetical protein
MPNLLKRQFTTKARVKASSLLKAENALAGAFSKPVHQLKPSMPSMGPDYFYWQLYCQDKMSQKCNNKRGEKEEFKSLEAHPGIRRIAPGEKSCKNRNKRYIVIDKHKRLYFG